MCGIAGMMLSEESEMHHDQLFIKVEKMIKTLIHRGPDDLGIQLVEDRICIANSRLSIVDIEFGHQPISSNDSHIVFNGEVYNFIDLKSQYTKNEEYSTNSDTEVIMRVYEKIGFQCFEKFNGMFAICIVHNNKVILARDRLGIKPLYYRISRDGLLFASEVKSLLEEKSDYSVSGHFLSFETNQYDDSFFSEIKQIPPGAYAIYDGKKIIINKYWDILSSRSQFHGNSYKSAIEYFRETFRDSVNIRIPTELPFGVTVSGGLDSTLVACLSKPDYLFTSIVKEDGYDEEHYVDALSKYLDRPLIKTYPNTSAFLEKLSKIVYYLDQPTTTLAAYPMYEVYCLAKKYVKVVLNGDGGDELFGGYARHTMLFIENLIKTSNQLNEYEPLKRHFWGNAIIKEPYERYAKLCQRGERIDSKVISKFRKIWESFPNKLMSSVGASDLYLSFPPLLRTNDRMSMANGIEVRSPFLDYRIVEFALHLSDEYKMSINPNGELIPKKIIKDAFGDIIPREILGRSDKIGFPSPVALWLRNEFSHLSFVVQNFIIQEPDILHFFAQVKPKLGKHNRQNWQNLQIYIWYLLFVKGKSVANVSNSLKVLANNPI